MQLTEKYRPARWADVVGQPKLLATIERLKERGSLAGRAYFISGPSGAGKTTIARLLAADVADSFFVEEVDATALTVAALRDMEREMNTSAWGRGGRAYLFNEAHGLRRDVIRQLLVLLERIPPHVLRLPSRPRIRAKKPSLKNARTQAPCSRAACAWTWRGAIWRRLSQSAPSSSRSKRDWTGNLLSNTCASFRSIGRTSEQ